MRKTLSCAYLLFCALLGFALPGARAEQFDACAQVKEDFNFYSEELRTQIFLREGRILPARNHDSINKLIDIYYKGTWLRISDEKLKLGKQNLCFTKNQCALVTQSTGLYKAPDLKEKKLGLASESQEYPIIGRFRSDKLTWYQVDLGDQVAWLLGQKIRVEERACGVITVGKILWQTEVEIRSYQQKYQGQYKGVFLGNYQEDLTQIDDPQLVVENTENMFVQILLHRIKERHRLAAGLGYGQRVFKIKKYADFRYFDGSTCQYDAPIIVQTEWKNDLISAPIQYSYHLIANPKHQFYVDSQLLVTYVLSPEYVYEHYIPCRQARKKIIVTESFEWSFIINLSYSYRFGEWHLGAKVGLLQTLDPVISLFIFF